MSGTLDDLTRNDPNDFGTEFAAVPSWSQGVIYIQPVATLASKIYWIVTVV